MISTTSVVRIGRVRELVRRPVERSPRTDCRSLWSTEHAVSSCFDIFGSKPTEGAGCAVVGVCQRCEGLFYIGTERVRS